MDNDWIVLDENIQNKPVIEHIICQDDQIICQDDQIICQDDPINDVIEDIERSINTGTRYTSSNTSHYNRYTNYCFDYVMYMDRLYNALIKKVFLLFNQYSIWKNVYKI